MCQKQLTKFRRDLHQIPELAMELPKTQAYIIAQLRELPCSLTTPVKSSVCAYFDNGKAETIAFRADMDALPILEKEDKNYKSLHEGNMHACAHDGHMAILLAFAHEVSTYYQELPYNILLIFQPGEETPGGAAYICEKGILKEYHVKHIFGLHLWPNLALGMVATKSKELMARASEVDIDIYGVSAHAALYREGVDALEAAVKFISCMYQMEKDEIDPLEHRILRFGVIESGTARNIVSNHAILKGSMRAIHDETWKYMHDRILEIAEEIKHEYHVTMDIHIKQGYPCVYNDEELSQRVLSTFSSNEVVCLETPVMTAEDFAYYQKEVPGVFFLLGTGTNKSLHSDEFDFDEQALQKGLELFIKLIKLTYE